MSNHECASATALSKQEEVLERPVSPHSVEAQVAGQDAGSEESSLALDEDIAHLIRRAHQRASATFMSVLATHNLTPAQYFALTRLREKGQVSQNLLGRMSAMDPATIQGVVKRLGERGFVARVPDPNDRRRMILNLTDRGVELIDGLRGGIEAMTDKILSPLSEDEQEQLRALLKRIV